MSRPFFRMHDDYSPLLSGAHRKPATPVGTPALVAHFAFWQPDSDWAREDEGQLDHKSVIDRWIANIDDYIRAIFCITRKRGFWCPNTEKKEYDESDLIFLFGSAINKGNPAAPLLSSEDLEKRQKSSNVRIDKYFGASYQSVVFIFVWHQTYVTIRFEIHSEYFTITCLIDLSFVRLGVEDGSISSNISLSEDEVFRRLNVEFNNILAGLKDMDDIINEKESPKMDSEVDIISSKHRTAHEYFYRGVWETFCEEILLSVSPLHNAEVDLDGTISDRHAKLGGVFADFRGLVLAPPAEQAHSWSSPFAAPAWRDYQSTQPSRQPPLITSPFAQELVHRLWPFLLCEPRAAMRSFEFTVSRMLGGRAVYITALGAQPSPYLSSTYDRTEDQLPLYYLAYFHTHSRWQIGRLMDRIHHLGTVRIAAIQNVRQLRDISTLLRGSSGPVDKLMKDVYNVLDNQKKKRQRVRVESLLHEVVNAQSKLALWSKGFPGGGIQYRIERSRYYVRQFQDALPSLRIKRVDGFQPYDIFVEHRLGATFGFIDRLGVRLERFERRLNSAYQYILAISAIRSAKMLVDVQIAAELFVWVIAAPYYVGSQIEHILLNSHDAFYPKYESLLSWISSRLALEGGAKGALSAISFFLEVAVFAAGLLVWIFRRHQIKKRED